MAHIEIGSAVQDGTGSERAWDRDGARFAAWVRRITEAARRPATIDASYAGMPPAGFVRWWCAKDSADHDLSLEQVPAAVAAYRPLVRSRPLRGGYAYAEMPPRVEYELTELGRTLHAPLAALGSWAEQHVTEVLVAREEYDGHR